MAEPLRSGLFVTGTDTGVGKTVVSTTIVRGLRARGIDVGAMKPAETGVGVEGPLDAQALHAAAGGTDPLELVCPVQLSMPAAPNVAAAAEEREVDLDSIFEAFSKLDDRHEMMIVEGAGGLLVPVTDEIDMAELAARLGLPVLVVARAELGTINHTLLTLAEIERRGLACAGVVVSYSNGELTPADTANFGDLRRRLGDRLIGEIPPLPQGAEAEPGLIDLDRLHAAMTHVANGSRRAL